jgi:hypothetical protein
MPFKSARRLLAAVLVACTATLALTATPAHAAAWHSTSWRYLADGQLYLDLQTYAARFQADGYDDGTRSLHAVLSVGHDFCAAVRMTIGRGVQTIASGCDNAWVEFDLPPSTGALSIGIVLMNINYAWLDAEGLSVPASTADLRQAGTGASWTSDGDGRFDFEVTRPGVRLTGTVRNAVAWLYLNRTSGTGCAVGEIGDVWTIQASARECLDGTLPLSHSVGNLGLFVYASYLDGGSQSPSVRLQLPQH